MTRFVTLSIAGLSIISCASRDVFPVPVVVPVPDGWHLYSHATLGNSECPRIAGKYVEPPDRYSTPGSQFANLSYPRLGYMAVLPFNLSEKEELTDSEVGFAAGEFQLVQPSERQFQLRDVNLKLELTQHTFKQEPGHFRCEDGKMYFPLLTRFGADQQGGFNFQHQGILASDVKGNLVLIRISGPFKKTLLHRKADFEYDFMRYNKIYE